LFGVALNSLAAHLLLALFLVVAQTLKLLALVFTLRLETCYLAFLLPDAL